MMASAPTILFLEMLKISKITFLNEIVFLKENEEHFRIFDNIKSIFGLMVVQTTSY
jgi:hypothetical protein